MVIFIITMIQIDVICSNQQASSIPCFSETVDSYLARLDQISKDYSTICSINNKLDIKALMDYSEKLAGLEAYASKPFSQVPANYTASSTFSDPNLNATLQGKTGQVLSLWRSGTNVTASMLADLRAALNTTIEYTCVSQQYPVFFLNNLFKLSEFRRQLVALKIFKASSSSVCLPSDWRYVTTIDYTSATNQIVIKYDPQAYYSTCDAKSNDFTINPVDLATGGIAISFWVREDFTLLQNGLNNLLSGIINNNPIFSYDLSKQNTSNVKHSIKVDNYTREIVSNSTCIEWVFVMLSVQRDCDKYRLITSIRFPGSNTNAYYEQQLKASQIENMLINYNSLNKFATINFQRFSRNFLYNFENEMMLMYIGGYPTEGCCAQCTPPAPNCSYYDSNGKCIICPINMFLLGNNCSSVCPDGYFGKNGICVICSDGCKKCTDAGPNQCYDCFSNSTTTTHPKYLYQNQCTDCPKNTFPYLLQNGTSVCTNCDPKCIECGDWNKCNVCSNDKFNFNKTCVYPCPQSTYPDSNKICTNCPDSCANVLQQPLAEDAN
jgi:hypothetical protein